MYHKVQLFRQKSGSQVFITGDRRIFRSTEIDYLFPKLHLIWVDAGYAGSLVDWVRYFIRCGDEIIKRCVGVARRRHSTDGFKVLPRRWLVERTLAWLGRYCRLSKDYEYHPINL